MKPRLPDQKTGELLADRSIAALAAALRAAGVSQRALARALTDQARTPGPGKARYPDPAGIDSAQLGTALALWFRDKRYTDRVTGLPVALRMSGRAPSLLSLLRAAGVTRATPQWADFLVRAGLVVRGADGRCLPVGRSARMPEMNALQVDHLALGIYQLVVTGARNFSRAGRARPLLQGAAVVRNLPAKEREAFRRFIHAQGHAFLANADDWLESRAAAGGKRRKGERRSAKTRAGVYAFGFIG